jgi:4-hydroxy-2-oxoheptanedioate aldolase
MSAVSLRARAETGQRLLGVLLRMPGEELVEMAAVAGFDFVLVDCEHGPADVVALRQHLAVAAVHGVPVVVRVGENDAGMILRALDQGAEGILAPHVDSAADARALVSAAHYPPIGTRGFATYSRAGRFGQTDAAAHRDWFLANTLVLGMIESPTGVAAAREIVGTAGLDGVMIGPADLAAASGPEDLPLPQATARVNEAIAAGGKLRMDIVGTTEAAASAFEDGAQLVVYNLAFSLMAHLKGLLAPRA